MINYTDIIQILLDLKKSILPLLDNRNDAIILGNGGASKSLYNLFSINLKLILKL